MKTEGSHGKVDLRKVQALLTGVVAAAMATILLLAVFALIVWKMEPSVGAENVGVICVSVLSCFAGGFFCGKKNDTKGFLWKCLCYTTRRSVVCGARVCAVLQIT